MFLIRIAIVVLLSLVATPAMTQQRIALLIGNQSYDATVGPLQNPHNDIRVVGAALKQQGFDILPEVKDARRSTILGAVRQLRDRLIAAGSGAVGFVYYSGHGAAESDTGVNYIIPVDARQPGSAEFWDDSLKLDDILKLLDGARGAAKFIVFDACRNELRVPAKSTTKGLVPVAEQQGMLIAYATSPGRTASDIGQGSGPFAAALAAELSRPGLDHLNLFQNVKEAVLATTKGVQQPWINDGLARRVQITAPVVLASPQAPVSEAAQAWAATRDSSSVAVLQLFAQRHAGTIFSEMAEARIKELLAGQAVAAAPLVAPMEKQSTSPAFERDLILQLQAGLLRTGCETRSPDGTWGPRSVAAATRFVEAVKLKIDVATPSTQLLDALSRQPSRVCPLVCPPGQKLEKGNCVSSVAAPVPTSKQAPPSECDTWRKCASFHPNVQLPHGTCGIPPPGCYR